MEGEVVGGDEARKSSPICPKQELWGLVAPDNSVPILLTAGWVAHFTISLRRGLTSRKDAFVGIVLWGYTILYLWLQCVEAWKALR